MVGTVKLTPRPQLDGFVDDALRIGSNIFDEWVSGKGKTEEKQLLEAQLAAQKAQQEQLITILKVGLIGAAVVLGVKYISGR